MRGVQLGIGVGMVLAIGCLQSKDPCEGPRVHVVDGECVPRDATDTGDEADADADTDADTDTDTDTDTGEETDSDGDGILNSQDSHPNDPTRCGDSDQDGCDDCTIEAAFAPDNDGWDQDDDGQCEVALDPACIHGNLSNTDSEREAACLMFALANLDRALFSDEADGAGPLEWSEDIWQVAISHSRDMCERNFYAHENPEGESPSDRADRLGFPDLSLAENIHIISDPILGHYDFMAEPTCVAHRSNILQPRAVQGAVALHYCDLQSNEWTGYRYVTENFHWDFDIEVGWCEIESHVCNDPDDPVSVARQYCSASECGPVEQRTFDRYCSR